MILRFVDFHMRQPSRNVNKVALACDCTEFTMLSPPHAALSLEHVCNGFLLSVMVNTGLARRLDDKESAPQPGLHSQIGRKRRATLRARRLGRRRIELRGGNNTNRWIIAHGGDSPRFRHPRGPQGGFAWNLWPTLSECIRERMQPTPAAATACSLVRGAVPLGQSQRPCQMILDLRQC